MKMAAAGIGALIIYTALAAYIGWNAYSWLQTLFEINPWFFAGVWIIWAYSYIVGRLGHKWLAFTIMGSYWMAFFQYALLLMPLANIIGMLADFDNEIIILGSVVAAILVLIFIMGTYLAYSPVVRELEIKAEGQKQDALHIVMASDFHLGVLSGKRHLQRFVNKSNKLAPDVVFLAGDLVDDDPVWYARYGMSEVMEQLKAPLGVHGVLGNHEYYGKKIPLLVRLMEGSGVNILRDETILVGNRFYLTGREDKTNGKRHPLEQLKPKGDLPWIIMDHTPSDLDTPVELGAVLHMSGHTHKGQMWPNSWITRKVFALDYGYRLVGKTNLLVSSGFGFWGPPIRIGSRSELWSIKIEFEV